MGFSMEGIYVKSLLVILDRLLELALSFEKGTEIDVTFNAMRID